MQKRQLKQLTAHIRSLPHYPHPPPMDWDYKGIQEFVNRPTTTFPEHFSVVYPYSVLHYQRGDITIGDLATHGLIMRNCFTGVVDDTGAQLFVQVDAFGEAFGFPKKKGSDLPSDLAWELAYPSLKRLHCITSEDMAVAIEKCVDGAQVIYHLWDHVFDKCAIREEAHAGYDLETRKQYEGFDSLPWYLKDEDEPEDLDDDKSEDLDDDDPSDPWKTMPPPGDPWWHLSGDDPEDLDDDKSEDSQS